MNTSQFSESKGSMVPFFLTAIFRTEAEAFAVHSRRTL
jgi:hypothetical protein